jgi:hypothetical protein
VEVSFKIIFKVLTSIALLATLLSQKSFATFQQQKDKLEELVEKQDYQTLWDAFITYFNEKPANPEESIDHHNFLEWIRSKAEKGHIPCTMFYAWKTILNGIEINNPSILNRGFAYALFSIIQTQIDTSSIDPNYILESLKHGKSKKEDLSTSLYPPDIVAYFFQRKSQIMEWYQLLRKNKLLIDCYNILHDLVMKINSETLPKPFWITNLGYEEIKNMKFNKENKKFPLAKGIRQFEKIPQKRKKLEKRRMALIFQASNYADYVRF